MVLNQKVDELIESTQQWKEEIRQFRTILLTSGLKEEWKWGQPCYCFQDRNICIIGVYKTSCVLSFLKGVLLNDLSGVLSKPGEDSQSVRFFKATSVNQIIEKEDILKSLINEAIEIEKLGLQVLFSEKRVLKFPIELLNKFTVDSNFKKAFESLTPGKQRGYNLYFSAPKQSKTRLDRIEKYASRILVGKGMHDCICGLSQRMPKCDGSHKSIDR